MIFKFFSNPNHSVRLEAEWVFIVQHENFSCVPVGKKQDVLRKHIQTNLNKPKTDGEK